MNETDAGPAVSGVTFTGPPQPGQRPPMPGLDPRVLEAQLAQNDRITVLTSGMMETTLANATRAFRWVTRMNVAMFATGLVLFFGSAVYGVVSGTDSVYPIVFAGLGAGTFIALFLTDSIAKTQDALSNLVQVEIAFMQWYSQMGVWHNYAAVPDPETGLPDPERIATASAGMQERSEATMKLLQHYTEGAPPAGG